MILEPITQQAVIETERYQLRPLQVSDAGLIALHTGDLRVARMTSSIPHPLPPGTTEAFIARCQSAERSEDAWAIDATKSGGAELLGVIGLKHVDDEACELGYWVAPQFWNSGIASEAVQALIEVNPLRCKTFFATVFQGNAASARVLTNCGLNIWAMPKAIACRGMRRFRHGPIASDAIEAWPP